MSRGIQLDRLNNQDLLDISYALFLEPLAADPKARDEAISKLGEPLPGTKKAKKAVARNALAQMGLTPEMVSKQLTERKKQREAREAEEAAKAAAEAETADQ